MNRLNKKKTKNRRRNTILKTKKGYLDSDSKRKKKLQIYNNINQLFKNHYKKHVSLVINNGRIKFKFRKY